MTDQTCHECSGTREVTCEGCKDREVNDKVQMAAWDVCARCDGTKKVTCPKCKGKGKS